MLILLPPSESKWGRARGRPVDPSRLAFPDLAPMRERVADALATVSARDDAHAVLGVSPRLRDEIDRNLDLATAPATPVADVYTGVLYDALDPASLDPAARRRAARRLLVVSALFGAVRWTDRIVPYRLAMDVDLPGIGPLAAAWRPHLEAVLPAAVGRGCIVDCRSTPYVAAWRPQGELADRWVHVRVPGASHGAKHTRGLVARHLCLAAGDPRTPQALADLVGEAFETWLEAPARRGGPWTLSVVPPG